MDSDSSQPTMVVPAAAVNSYTTNTVPPPPSLQQQQQQQLLQSGVGSTTAMQTVPSPVQVMSQQQLVQTQNHNANPKALPRFPFNSAVNTSSAAVDYSDGPGASPRTGGGFSIEPPRKKRGRPRKYSPDGNIALGLSPTPVAAVSSVSGGGHGDYSGGGGGGRDASSEPTAKRSRGRPPGSSKKQLNALGTQGMGFTPHVITVKAGEDIASKVMAFAQQGPRTVCILSATGCICSVTLRQSSTSGGTVTYEGRFEIVSLSGGFFPAEINGNRNRTGGLFIILGGSDGRVLGGGVAGMLLAANPVQVVVGSFIADGKKSKSLPPPMLGPNILSFGAPVTGASPPSQGGGCSDSSDENGGSPIDRTPGPFSNTGQPINMPPMYANMGWANSGMKMHPN